MNIQNNKRCRKRYRLGHDKKAPLKKDIKVNQMIGDFIGSEFVGNFLVRYQSDRKYIDPMEAYKIMGGDCYYSNYINICKTHEKEQFELFDLGDVYIDTLTIPGLPLLFLIQFMGEETISLMEKLGYKRKEIVDYHSFSKMNIIQLEENLFEKNLYPVFVSGSAREKEIIKKVKEDFNKNIFVSMLSSLVAEKAFSLIQITEETKRREEEKRKKDIWMSLLKEG